MSFRLNDGEILELYTAELDYLAFQEGIHGTLVWQNENLLRFQPDE